MGGRYRPYPEYKDSEIEWLREVPVHWHAKQLKFNSTCNDEVLTDSLSQDYEIEYVDIGSVSAMAGIISTEIMTFGNAPSRARRIVRDGDIIVSTVRTYLQAIAPIVSPSDNLIVSTGFAVIRPNLNLFKGYGAYALRDAGFINEVVARSVGVSYPAINSSDLINIKVPLPSFGEQETIANFLDHETAKIDTLIYKQQQLIVLLKEKRQAVISHAVTKGLNSDVPMKDSGVGWLGDVPEHWVVKSLSIATDHISVGLATSVTDFYKDSGVPIIRNLNIKEGYFDGTDMLYLDEAFAAQQVSKAVNGGDVIVVHTGSNIGLACVVPREFDQCHTFTTLIVSTGEELLNRYLTYCINSVYGKVEVDRLKLGFGKDNLNVKEFKFFHTIIPTYEEQISIADFLDRQTAQIDRLIEKTYKTIKLIQERRTALISAAVTGKIDVRNWQPPIETQADKDTP